MGVHLKHGKWKKNIDAHRVHECHATHLKSQCSLHLTHLHTLIKETMKMPNFIYIYI